ncbi:MAG: alpha/beta hydrolase [Planctomycetaceae bacterium]
MMLTTAKSGNLVLAFSLLCCMVMAVPECFSAEPAEVINLWTGTPPGPEREVGEEADTTGADGRTVADKSVIRLGNVSVAQAHVYLPADNVRNGSAVVICPGGGFNILAWDLEGTEVAEWFTSIGVTAIVLKYRVPTRAVDPMWLQPVHDAQRAISIIRGRAAQFQLKSDRIGILGFSAGGHTAARTALTFKRHYEASDNYDGVSCAPDIAMLIYPAYLSNKENTALEEDLLVTADTPPMFLVHAFDDGIPAEGSLLMAMALRKSKVPSELHMYDTGGHGYGLRPVADRPVTTWPKRAEDWLRRIGWIK